MLILTGVVCLWAGWNRIFVFFICISKRFYASLYKSTDLWRLMAVWTAIAFSSASVDSGALCTRRGDVEESVLDVNASNLIEHGGEIHEEECWS